MTQLLALGTVTFVAGAIIAWFSSRGRRLGLGIAALGIGTLSMTQLGPLWIAISIAFSSIAIVLIASVLWSMLGRR